MKSNRPMIKLDILLQRLRNNDPTLTSLNLADVKCSYFSTRNMANYTDEVLIKIADAISANRTLKHFTLSTPEFDKKPSWTVRGAKALANAVQAHTGLESLHLDFSHDNLEAKVKSSFLRTFANAHITELIVKFAKIDNDAIKRMGRYLRKNSTLKAVTIWGGDFDQELPQQYDGKVWDQLANGLKGKQLTHFKMDEVYLEDGGFEKLANVLSEMKSIQSLVLSYCFLTANSTNDINKICATNSDMQTLDLQYNLIKQEGLENILPSISSLKKLKKLNLHDTGLNDAAMDKLVTCLQVASQKLNTLLIGSNELSSICTPSIRRLLASNKSLMRLDVGMKATDDDICELRDALSKTNIAEIILYNSEQLTFRSSTYDMLAEVCRQNKAIFSLSLLGMPAELLDILKQNHEQHLESRQQFVSSTTVLANGFFNQSIKSSSTMSQLPPEIFLAILMECGKDALGMNAQDVKNCCELIMSNMSIRQELQSTQVSTSVSDWWQQTNADKERIFTEKQEEGEVSKPSCRLM